MGRQKIYDYSHIDLFKVQVNWNSLTCYERFYEPINNVTKNALLLDISRYILNSN